MRVIVVQVATQSAGRCDDRSEQAMDDLADRLRHEMRFGRGSRPSRQPDVIVGVFVADLECSRQVSPSPFPQES